MKARTKFAKRALATLGTVSLVALSAHAQDAGPTDAGVDGDGFLERVVVTAQRKSENLQSAAVAVTAFTGQAIERLGIKDVQDLSLQTPSLNIKAAFGAVNPNIFIRGVGINDFNANVSGAVGVYVDDVYLGSPAGQLFQFFDAERVEVLKGPQGTLYGRNTTGGAVNFISRKPTGEANGHASIDYGRFNEVRVEGAVGFPIAEKISARVAGVFNRRDGITFNRFTGENGNDVENWAGRVLLLVEPTDDFEVLFNVHAGGNGSDSLLWQHRGLIDFGDGVGRDALGYADLDDDPWAGDYNFVGEEDLDLFGASATINWSRGTVTVTSITAYESVERATVEDTDGSPNSLLQALYDADSEQFSQELRVSYRGNSPIEAIAGAYYLSEDLEFDGSFDTFRDVRPAIEAAAAGLGLGMDFPGGFNPLGSPDLAAMLGDPIFAVPTFFARYGYDQEIENWALFGQADYNVTEAFTATLGLRYTEEKRKFDYVSAFDEGIFAIPLVDVDNEAKFSKLSGRVALDYQFNEAVFGYASVSRGFKSGGFNGGLLFMPIEAEPFDEETLTAYEIGFKTEWGQGRARTNITAFYYDYSDLQVFTIVNNGGIPQQVLSNAADATVFGLELETEARPVPELYLRFGLTVLDSELKNFVTEPALGGVDFSGNRLPFAPKANFTGAAFYEIPVTNGSLVRIGGDFSYQSKIFTETSNLERLAIDGTFLLNAQISFLTSDERWEFSVWGRNLTDAAYEEDFIDLSDFGYDLIKHGDPITVGASVTLRLN